MLLVDTLKNTTFSILPEKPGVYQFFDKKETILYIGKAKNLKKRILSYFKNFQHSNTKLNVLEKKIYSIQYIIVNNETDALLLENNLIKQYQPRYNVRLKDDKTYPWICIKNEPFPRVFSTRNVIKDGSLYFGPYASVQILKTILSLINQLYKIRNCNYLLTQENITKKKFKPCLEYDIGNCNAPCIGLENEASYKNTIDEIKHILRGNISELTARLEQEMLHLSKHYKFEEANVIKQKLDLLHTYKAKSTIVNPQIKNADVFSIIEDDKFAFVNHLKIIDGAIIQSNNNLIEKKLDETKEDILTLFISDIYIKSAPTISEVIIPFSLDYTIADLIYTIPQAGDKMKLLELSQRNVSYFRIEFLKKQTNVLPVSKNNKLLYQVKADLALNALPIHIECFDNSNIQGMHAVAACVVFINGKPSKKDYRLFTIKNVEGPNDYASFEEVLLRRFKRLIAENQPLPQLLVIDGGKGQLHIAQKILISLQLHEKINIISIAKRLEEIYKPNDPLPLYIDKKSSTLKLIQHLRNEAHRFAITFHRKKRSNAMIKTELDSINGIGNETKKKLLNHFETVKAIKQASIEELQTILKNKLYSEHIYNFFHSNSKHI